MSPPAPAVRDRGALPEAARVALEVGVRPLISKFGRWTLPEGNERERERFRRASVPRDEKLQVLIPAAVIKSCFTGKLQFSRFDN